MFFNRISSFITNLKLTSSRIILLGFAVPILLGTVLLALPISSSSGLSIGWLAALFTSTSAVCVTGLVVLDTGTDFSHFGQMIILLLIQIGGLGFMTFSVLIAVIMGKKIGLKERLLIQQSSNSVTTQGVVRLSLSIFLITFIVETAGAILLALRWANELGTARSIYYGIFHSVSAFNNAGFGLWPDSLSRYVGDPLVNIVISLLFIVGGIGFTVILDLYRKRRWRDLSLHTKIVLITSGLLCMAGFLVIFAIELFNTETFSSLSWSERFWAAYFQGVVTRTAGFNSIDIGAMLPASQFFMIFLMFVGASSGSTGGGIKTTTFAVLMLSIVSTIKGKTDVQLLKKRISQDIIFRALAVLTISLGVVLTATFLLSITEYAHPKDFLALLFEVTSAFGTVGMSMNLTQELSPLGKCIIIITMYIGRLGPLTLALALAQKNVKQKYRYPEDKLLIG
ncbi:TrkH family potassium uptake protein [Paenibacillus tritici]|uniref:TrkH family potassium uptake protein n=1 Tax=Paenibacillus tritici TaxID=1873425 RepID=UPI001BA7B8D0|nr:TrkH family potassium uptake protein [Paenibacillus tritici]QUL53534.1 TrkH family potassium uptake protein [Paenibacillus tritici]